MEDPDKIQSAIADVIRKLTAAAEGDTPLADQIEECFDLIEQRKSNVTLNMIAKALQLDGIDISSQYLAQILARTRKKRGIAKRKSKKRAASKSGLTRVPKDLEKMVSVTPAKSPAAASQPVRPGEFNRNTGRTEDELF